MKRARFYVWVGILLLLIAMGIYGVVRQTAEGHVLTGQSDLVPWGLYIVGFVFFVGTSAGATIIGLMIHAFGRDDYQPLGTRALLVGLLSLMAAVLFLMTDVGNAAKAALIPWVLGNPTSMFFYTSLTYYLFGLLLIAEIYFAIKIARRVASQREKNIAKWLAIIAFPVALWVVAAPDGALFAVIKAREYWNTPLLPPHFAIAALVSGTAVMILVAILTSKLGRGKLVSNETMGHMGKLLALFITVTIFFDVFDLAVLNYSPSQEGIEAWGLLTGRNAPLFVLNIGGLLAALLILIFKRGGSIPGLAVASTLALVAVAAYRYNLLAVGLQVPLLPDLPEIHYYPTGIEIAVSAGLVAFALLLYTLLTRKLPTEELS